MVAAIVFIVVKIYKLRPDFSMLLSEDILPAALIALVVQSVSTWLLSSYGFTKILGGLSEKPLDSVNIRLAYCKSNLYKYLPGNIMHFVGRNKIAADEDIPHSEVIMATLAEIILTIITACIIVLILSFSYFIDWFKNVGVSKTLFIIAFAAIAVVIVLAVIFRKKIGEFIKKYKVLYSKKMLGILGISSLVYIFNFLLSASMSALLIEKLCHTDMFFTVTGLSVMAWLVGFITPGAPGGIGIREAVMTMFLSSSASEENLLAAVLFYRIICIFGDVLAFVMSALHYKIKGGTKHGE